MLTEGVFLFHDNAPVHKALIAQDAIRACGFQQVNQPSYSPDVASSDCCRFRYVESLLYGRSFKDEKPTQVTGETHIWKTFKTGITS